LQPPDFSPEGNRVSILRPPNLTETPALDRSSMADKTSLTLLPSRDNLKTMSTPTWLAVHYARHSASTGRSATPRAPDVCSGYVFSNTHPWPWHRPTGRLPVGNPCSMPWRKSLPVFLLLSLNLGHFTAFPCLSISITCP